VGGRPNDYLTDGLGSAIAEVISTGTNVLSRQYDVVGAVLSTIGSLTDERQFAAGEQADPTGLTYLRAVSSPGATPAWAAGG